MQKKIPPTRPDNRTTTRLLREADKCVKCGLCLPVCPTYTLAQVETESPRGRIALIQSLLKQDMTDNSGFSHLDNCLLCRACESACPSRVRYGALIDGFRSDRHASTQQNISRRLILFLVARPALLQSLLGITKKILNLPLIQRVAYASASLVPPLRLLRNALSTGTAIKPRQTEHANGLTKPAGKSVFMFTGCMERQLSPATVESARHVLETLGYEVRIPDKALCCGALHHHNGELPVAAALARSVTTQVAGSEHVVSLASGCSSHLSEYTQFEFSPQNWSNRFSDITVFLAAQDWTRAPAFRAVPKRILLHLPCSLTYPLKGSQQLHKLLERIPSLQIEILGDDNLCCGAAGSYMLTHAATANRLRARKLASLDTGTRYDALVSANIGCRIHLLNGLQEKGIRLPVVHPLEIIADALGNTGQHD